MKKSVFRLFCVLLPGIFSVIVLAGTAFAANAQETLLSGQIALLGDRYAGHRYVGQMGRQFPVFYVKRETDRKDTLIETFFAAYDEVLVEMVDRSLCELEALQKQALSLREEAGFSLLTATIEEKNNRVLLTFAPETAEEERLCFLGLLGNPKGVAAVNAALDDGGEEISVIAKGRAYVRSGPSADTTRAKVLGQLKKGDMAALYASADSLDKWYCIRFGDGIGYVKKQYFSVG